MAQPEGKRIAHKRGDRWSLYHIPILFLSLTNMKKTFYCPSQGSEPLKLKKNKKHDEHLKNILSVLEVIFQKPLKTTHILI